MNTVGSELEVPAAATDALHNQWPYAPAAEAVRAIATPVVIAELRRLADYLPERWDDIVGPANVADIADDILKRANGLEAGQ